MTATGARPRPEGRRDRRAGAGSGDGLRALGLALAVGLAFADSSIVVLAVPDLLAELGAPLQDVAWVVTAYNLAVATGAVAAVPLLRAGRAASLCRAGLAVFTAASVACALAPDLPALVVARAVRGAGAALLLAGSLPALAALLPGAALAAWARSGAIGAALGPALGGALTQAFDWRAVFVVQVPLGAAALLALRRPLPAAPAVDGAPADDGRPRPAREGEMGRWRLAAAHAALVLVSGGLVGALFLVVVLLVDGWQLDPLAAAGIATAVPVAAVLSGLLAGRIAPAVAVPAGALLLAVGLCGLALLPVSSPALVAGWLGACGTGLGLGVPPLVEATVGGRTPEELGRSGSWSTASRHLGLTLALLVVPVVLTDDLGDAVDRAVLRATSEVLDAQVPLGTKVPLARGLAAVVAATPAGDLPDLSPAFAELDADPDSAAELRTLEGDLEETVRASIVRGFRGALLVTAALAASAVLPGLLLARRHAAGGTARTPAPAAAVAAVAVVAGLLGTQVATGGTTYGAAPARDPCAGTSTYPGDEVDDRVQRVVLVALDRAACDLRSSREVVLLSLLPDRGQQRLTNRIADLDEAVREGLLAGIDEERERGLNVVVAIALREVVRRADLRELVDELTG